MGYSSSPKTTSTSSGDKEMDELMKLLAKYMSLASKKDSLIAELASIDSEMGMLLEQIQSHPKADAMKQLIFGMTNTPPKR